MTIGKERHPGPITHGLGRLTPSLWLEMFDLLEFVSTYRPQFEQMASRELRGLNRPGPTIFPALITGSRELDADTRHEYSWAEAWYDAEAERFVARDDGQERTSEVEGDVFGFAARNGCEVNNEPQGGLVAPGVDTGGPDYPAGFSWQPVGVMPVVAMIVTRDNRGQPRPWFFAVNAHDGTCG